MAEDSAAAIALEKKKEMQHKIKPHVLWLNKQEPVFQPLITTFICSRIINIDVIPEMDIIFPPFSSLLQSLPV